MKGNIKHDINKDEEVHQRLLLNELVSKLNVAHRGDKYSLYELIFTLLYQITHLFCMSYFILHVVYYLSYVYSDF